MNKNLLDEFYKTSDEKKRKLLVEELLEYYKYYLDIILENILNKLELRNNAYLLNLMSKKKRVNDYLKHRFSREHFNILVKDNDPKCRKNAYIFMGNFVNKEFVKDLIIALKNENTNYCISSLVLSLGNYGIKNIEEIMEKYLAILNKKLEDKQIEQVHYDEILISINKVVNKNKEVKKHTFKGLVKEEKILLTCMKPLINSSLNCIRKEFKMASKYSNGILIKTDNLDKVYKLRTFYESLFVFDNNLDLNSSSLINHILKVLGGDFLSSLHLEDFPFSYRIEYVTTKNKSEKQAIYDLVNTSIINKFKDKYYNNPSLYEFEIRIIDNEKGNYDVFYKLYTYEDKRFSYRKRDLPASINQASAAMMLNEVNKYLKKDASVLDPFCGSASMLIERDLLLKTKSLTGVDISSEAIECAYVNSKTANIKIKLVNQDCLEHVGVYDEIISNMPYGNRVGTHLSNEILYAGFINKLPELLNNSGVAILLTSEISLLKSLVKANKKLKLLEDIYTETGGLTPHLFVIKKV